MFFVIFSLYVIIFILFLFFSGNTGSRLYTPYTVGKTGKDCPAAFDSKSGLCGKSENILSLEYILKEQLLDSYVAVDSLCIFIDVGTQLPTPLYITFTILVTKPLILPLKKSDNIP